MAFCASAYNCAFSIARPALMDNSLAMAKSDFVYEFFDSAETKLIAPMVSVLVRMGLS